MKWFLTAVVAMFCLGSVACMPADEDEDFSEGNMKCNIKEMGSSIVCMRMGGDKCNKNKTSDDTTNKTKECCDNAPVAIRIHKVVEVDEDNAPVGGDKHSVVLMKKHFKFGKGGPKKGSQLPRGKPGKTPKGKGRDIDVSLEPTPGKKAGLTMSLFLISEAGELDNGGEVVDVKKGQLKINTRLADWFWCGGDNMTEDATNCDGKNGSAILLYFSVENQKANGKKPMPEKEEKNKPKKFSMDCGATVDFSTKALLDNETWVDMGDDYPMVSDEEDESKGKGQGNMKPGAKLFAVRFPRFAGMVDYDPTLDMDSEGGDGGDGDSGASSVFPIVSLIASMLLGVHMAW